MAGQGTATRAEFVTMLSKVVDGVMAGVDLTGKGYQAEITWVPEYETVEVPVYEEQWVDDIFEGECTHYYCCHCGYDADCYIPSYIIQENLFVEGGLVGTIWDEKFQEVLRHVQSNECGANDDGIPHVDWGTGQERVWHRVELGTGHYEQVQVGTKTEQHEVGGHWELSGGHWA